MTQESSINPYDATNIYSEATESIYAVVDTPEEQVLATRIQRLLAYIVDSLLILMILFAILFIISCGYYLSNGMSFEETMSSIYHFLIEAERTEPPWTFFNKLAWVLLHMALFMAINGRLLSTRGQTVGKLLLRIRIVSDFGYLMPLWPLFWKRYLVLELIGVLGSIGVLIGLLDPLLIFRKNRKCWHDHLAGTKVIQVPIRDRTVGK